MNPELPKVTRREILLTGVGVVGTMAALGSVPLPALAQTSTQPGSGDTLPQQQIESIMQTTGTLTNGVLIIELERSDLKVTGPQGIPFKPAFELKHEFHFQPTGAGQAILNAESTFIQSEMTAVLDAILGNGLTIMAQHQHFIGENPQTWHHHFRGIGDPVQLAQAAIAVVKASGTPLPQSQPSNPTTPLPKDRLAAILGGSAQVGSDGVVTVSVPRTDSIVLAGVTLKPDAGVSHTIAFQPLDSSGQTVACAPDYAFIAAEINPALRTARALGFEVHCLYNQETAEVPQLYFSHQIAQGDPIDLAQRVRQVLNTTNAANTPGMPMSVSGVISSVGATTLTIGKTGATTTLRLSPNTQYSFRGRILPSPMVILNPGLSITANAALQADGSLLALLISVQ